MIYLGIDVAKNSHVAAAMSSEGEVLLMPFSFANSADGFTLLREKLNNLPKLPLLVGLESTAHYGENLWERIPCSHDQSSSNSCHSKICYP